MAVQDYRLSWIVWAYMQGHPPQHKEKTHMSRGCCIDCTREESRPTRASEEAPVDPTKSQEIRLSEKGVPTPPDPPPIFVKFKRLVSGHFHSYMGSSFAP